MTPAIENQVVPLTADSGGVLRIGGTRVPLDTVASAFESGYSCEEIAQQYPSLQLSDIYVVVGYYLSHRGDLQSYFAEREAESKQARSDTKFAPRESNQAIRDRLLSRRATGT